MSTKLVDVRIDEVSSVDRPANLTDGWLLLKSVILGADPDDPNAVATKERHNIGDDSGRFAVADSNEKLPGIEPAEEDKRPRTPLPAWVQPIRDYIRAKDHHTSRPPFADPVSKELTRGREYVTGFAEKPKQLTQDEVIDQLVAHAERLGIVVNEQLAQLPGR